MSVSGQDSELFQLDRSTCVALLGTQHVGRLVIGGDDPTIVPVNYTATDGLISFRTAEGGLLDRAASRSVLFEVDMFDDRTRSGWSVVVQGPLLRRTTDAVIELETWAPGDRTRWMMVRVETITGRLLRGRVDAEPDVSRGYL